MLHCVIRLLRLGQSGVHRSRRNNSGVHVRSCGGGFHCKKQSENAEQQLLTLTLKVDHENLLASCCESISESWRNVYWPDMISLKPRVFVAWFPPAKNEVSSASLPAAKAVLCACACGCDVTTCCGCCCCCA